MSSSIDYIVGSIIEIGSEWRNEVRRVRVTFKSSDIKNGEPGFDGQYIDGDKFPVWGYDAQIIRVVTR